VMAHKAFGHLRAARITRAEDQDPLFQFFFPPLFLVPAHRPSTVLSFRFIWFSSAVFFSNSPIFLEKRSTVSSQQGPRPWSPQQVISLISFRVNPSPWAFWMKRSRSTVSLL